MSLDPKQPEAKDVDVAEMQSVAMNAIMRFSLNFPHDFIEKVWSGRMAEHMKSKFDSYYSRYGATGAFSMFWAALDLENRDTLNRYILRNGFSH